MRMEEVGGCSGSRWLEIGWCTVIAWPHSSRLWGQLCTS